jgi:hypothetical protein
MKLCLAFFHGPSMNWVLRLTLLTTPLGWLTTTTLRERIATAYGKTIWRKEFF